MLNMLQKLPERVIAILNFLILILFSANNDNISWIIMS